MSKKYFIAFNDIFRHWQKIISVPGKFHQLILSQREAMQKMLFLTWNRMGESWSWKMLMIWDEKWQSTCKPSRNRNLVGIGLTLFFICLWKKHDGSCPRILKIFKMIGLTYRFNNSKISIGFPFIQKNLF